MKHAVTITFGDQAENHKGMQIIGTSSPEGFNYKDIENAYHWFKNIGYNPIIYTLNTLLPLEYQNQATPAYLLYVPGGVNAIISADKFLEEQDNLKKDTRAYMYGREVEKRARHNLCFGPVEQQPDYQNGKGTIVSYEQVEYLNMVRKAIPIIMGSKGENMVAEGNYYYDINKTGIGYHGDSERKKVFAIRLGASIPLTYQWYLNYKPVGERGYVKMNHGDIYVMSEKAVGTDWKKKTILTLRHAAGADKYITIDNKK